jgi:translation initiation factor IF-1
MPSYEICYQNADGTPDARIAAECTNDTQAKVLAHAMKKKGRKRITVWEGDKLIYQRPLTSAEG